MIELKDVSYKEVLCKYENKYFYNYCMMNHVQTLEDVYNLYLNYDKNEKTMLDRDFKEMFKRLKLTNLRGGYPDVYNIDEYTDKELEYNDSLNKGNILIFDNPTNNFTSRTFEDVKKMSIKDIKYDLTHSMINGYNYLRFICNRIGPDKLLIIQRALNYYTKQIENQAKLTSDRNINLFNYQKEERFKIVNDMIDEIITYLVNNTKEELVWGYINEPRRNAYLLALSDNKKVSKQIIQMVSDYISNYITIEEAYDLKNNKEKILKRFIIK